MASERRDASPVRPSAGRAWWAIFVLFLAYMLSYIDRTIIALLVEPLRQDLGLTDTEISLLQGLAFAIFYSTISLPIAVLSDRMSRRRIIGIGIAFWSLMTSACGLAANFWQLFAARMGVGVGEATLGPAAYSLIADLFPEEKRGRAMVIFSSGVSVGGGLAFIVGGMIVAFAATADFSGTLLADFAGWQIVFLVLGPPGILVALLMATVAEPRNARPAAEREPSPPAMPFLRRHGLFFGPLFVASAISGMMMTAILYWGPAYLMRVHGLTAPEAGQALGLGLLLAGPAGAIAGGSVSDAWTRRGIAAAPVWTVAIGIALMGIAGVAAALAASATVAAICASAAFFFGSFAYPGGAAAIQKTAPDRLRARVAALYLFVVTLFAAALGPTLIALITDFGFGVPEAVGRSLAVALAVSGPLGVACALFAAFRLGRLDNEEMHGSLA